MKKCIALLTGSILLAGSIAVLAEGEANENSKTYTTTAEINEPVKTWVLLSSESSEWRKSAGQLVPDQSASKRNRMVIIPQRFLIDGDILWVGLGGRVGSGKRMSPDLNMHASGLLKLDLSTGCLLACRYGKVKGDERVMGPILGDSQIDRDDVYNKSVLPIFKWHDYIVVGQRGVGVFLYPLLAGSTVAGLSDVTVINMDTGLPSNQLLSIAAFKDQLFIMTGPGTVRIQKDGKWITRTGGEGWILSEWRQNARTVKILADSQKQIGGIELQNSPVGQPQMAVNSTNGCLNFKFTLGQKNPDGVSMKNTGQALYIYDPSANKWQLADTNALTMLKPDTESGRIVPEDYLETYDIQNYKDGTLAITGYGRSWELVFFYKEGDTNVARWIGHKKNL